MELGQLLRFGHALAGVTFMAEIVGNWIVIGFARRAESLEMMRLLLRTAAPFGLLVTGGGITLSVLGVAAAVALGHPLFGPLQGGRIDWMFVSNLLMLPIFGFLISIYPRVGRLISVALRDAEVRGGLTPELAVAWADTRLRVARTYEFVATVVVLGLMIARPF